MIKGKAFMSTDRNSSRHTDSMYTGEKYQPNFMDMSLSKIRGGLFILITVLIIKTAGWAAAAGFAAGAAAGWILWNLIRKKGIIKSSVAGYVNSNGQVTGNCLTPGWKYDQCFYKLECSHCGQTQDIRADRIKNARCPHCQTK